MKRPRTTTTTPNSAGEYDTARRIDEAAGDILAAARAVYAELTITIDKNPGLKRAIDVIEDRVRWLRDDAAAPRMDHLGVGMEATARTKEAAAE